jgi:hypothetical protein
MVQTAPIKASPATTAVAPAASSAANAKYAAMKSPMKKPATFALQGEAQKAEWLGRVDFGGDSLEPFTGATQL